MRVVIAGGREFGNYELLREICDEHILPDSEIVSGGARGTDKLGERYAKETGRGLKIFPADWDKHGKGAGHIRNKQMAEYSDMLIAFWDGESKGTKNMIETSKKLGLILYVHRY
jgi:hypothetical protein